MSHHLIEVRDLDFKWPDGRRALVKVNFRITHGEAVGLVGANGAGKSTLLLHLVGVHLAQSGSVRVGDVPVTRETLRVVRQSVGLVFQDPDDQLFCATVQDDVAFGPRQMGLPEAEVLRRTTAALEAVEGTHLASRPPWHLSTGEKRAAAIAGILAMEPDILVMDEPTAGLDPRGRRQLIRLLRGFQHTKIIATHDLDLVLDLCPRTLVLKDGSLEADGPTRDLLTDVDLLHRNRLEKPLRLQGCPLHQTPGASPETENNRS